MTVRVQGEENTRKARKAKQVLKVINIKETDVPMEGWFGVDHIPHLVPKS